jgi:hypothetical protein
LKILKRCRIRSYNKEFFPLLFYEYSFSAKMEDNFPHGHLFCDDF